MDEVTEERLRRAADEAAVRNVIARLAQLADSDTDDFAEYLSLWTPGATTAHPTDTAVGHEQILERSRELRRRGTQGPGTDTLHVITTQWVRVDGDVATSRSYWCFYGKVSQHPPELRAMGVYDDTLERDGDAWRLSRRRVSYGT